MASKKGHSTVGIFGSTTHYDSKGHKIGVTNPSIFGGATHYDTKGKKIGTSSPNLFGGETIYDAHHRKIGSTLPGLFSTTYYDAKHNKVGSSTPFLGSSRNDCDLSNKYENLYEHSRSNPLAVRNTKSLDPYDPSPYSTPNVSKSSKNSKPDALTVAAFVVAIVIVGVFLLQGLTTH